MATMREAREQERELERLKEEVTVLRQRLEERELALADLGTQLERITRTDPLSGALNRRAILDVLEGERRRAERYGRPLAIILLDLDRFKLVNDMHGPAAGDEAIGRLAGICRAALRGTDFIGRYDGEEFLAVLPEVGRDGALVAAERIRAAMQAERFSAGESSFTVTVSGGIAELAQGKGLDLDRILANADAALSEAKGRGRNRVEVHGRR